MTVSKSGVGLDHLGTSPATQNRVSFLFLRQLTSYLSVGAQVLKRGEGERRNLKETLCAVRGRDGGEIERRKGDLKPKNMRLSVSLVCNVVSRLGPPVIAALP